MPNTEPFDLDAFIAEAEQTPFSFIFDGDTYVMPNDLDMRAIAAMADGRLEQALTILLGDEQWDRMCAAKVTFGARALHAVLDHYAAHVGADLGNSSGSTGSSKSTAGPSKRTSSATTKSRSRTSQRGA